MGADRSASAARTRLARFVEEWVDSGDVTAVFAAVARGDRTLWSRGAAAPGAPAPTAQSLFDAASLTKPWMATLALCLDATGDLPFSTPIGEVWTGCAPALASTPLGRLLEHRAGFEAWTPLYRRALDRNDAERLLVSGALLQDPMRERVHSLSRERLAGSTRPRRGGEASPSRSRGSRSAPPAVQRSARTSATSIGPDNSLEISRAGPGSTRMGQRYSDLDYILWGFAAERRLGVGLAELLRRRVLAPLGIDGVAIAPGPRAGVVPCLCDNGREVELAAQQRLRVAHRGPPAVGEPQDGNARFLGGLGAHAGLFVSADAALTLGREWLRALDGESRLLRRESAEAAIAGRGEYALGWAHRRVGGSAGRALSRQAFGHIGFTGGSLWIDPESRSVLVLLAHRRSPAVELNAARRHFHALAAALG